MSILSASGKASTNDKCTGVILETSTSLNKSEDPGTLLWRDHLLRHKTSVASADNLFARSTVPYCGKKGQDVRLVRIGDSTSNLLSTIDANREDRKKQSEFR